MRDTPTNEQLEYLNSLKSRKRSSGTAGKTSNRSSSGVNKRGLIQRPPLGVRVQLYLPPWTRKIIKLVQRLLSSITVVLVLAFALSAQSEDSTPSKLDASATATVAAADNTRLHKLERRVGFLENELRLFTSEMRIRDDDAVRAVDRRITAMESKLNGVAHTAVADSASRTSRVSDSVYSQILLFVMTCALLTIAAGIWALVILAGLMMSGVSLIQPGLLKAPLIADVNNLDGPEQVSAPPLSVKPPTHSPDHEVAIEPSDVFLKTLLNNVRNARCMPELALSPWRLACASAQGNVRSENQDYAMGFEIGDYQVLVIADGCGGLPYGAEASFFAAKAATRSIVVALRRRFRKPPITQVLHDAMSAAEAELGRQVIVHSEFTEGLRTTLILILAHKSEVAYTYIGDGGAVLVRGCGEVIPLMVPQKADLTIPNVLSASLGPLREGAPQYGTVSRSPGDLIIAGTDGVFDRVDRTFAQQVAVACCDRNGMLQEVVEQILSEFADYKDEFGFAFDDNMSLGVIGTGAGVPEHSNFCNKPQAIEAVPTVPKPVMGGSSGRVS